MADDPNAGRIWGWISEGEFRPLPRWPGVDQVPPFDVTLPSGEIRHVIWKDMLPDERHAPTG
jgi:hypothetical protein